MPSHTQVRSNRTCHLRLLADRPSMAHDPLSDVEDLRQPGLAVRDALISSHVRLRDVLVIPMLRCVSCYASSGQSNLVAGAGRSALTAAPPLETCASMLSTTIRSLELRM